MRTRIVTILLLVGLGFSLLALIPRLGSYHLPGNHKGYEPTQPIAFSHRLHAGELQISCAYCHSGADQSRHAGIPATSLCLNCHKFPLGSYRDELDQAKKDKRAPRLPGALKNLYDALGLNEKLESVRPPHPIAWVKVHNLPDFVYFDHRAHVRAGVACQKCHGPVESMERIRQVEDLSMGWCVNCHREVNHTGVASKKVHASIDCATCHY